MASNFTVVVFQRQHFGKGARHLQCDARRARTDPAITAGRNRDVVTAAIRATFTWGEAPDVLLDAGV